jgi:hypothetical protein
MAWLLDEMQDRLTYEKFSDGLMRRVLERQPIDVQELLGYAASRLTKGDPAP